MINFLKTLMIFISLIFSFFLGVKFSGSFGDIASKDKMNIEKQQNPIEMMQENNSDAMPQDLDIIENDSMMEDLDSMPEDFSNSDEKTMDSMEDSNLNPENTKSLTEEGVKNDSVVPTHEDIALQKEEIMKKENTTLTQEEIAIQKKEIIRKNKEVKNLTPEERKAQAIEAMKKIEEKNKKTSSSTENAKPMATENNSNPATTTKQ